MFKDLILQQNKSIFAIFSDNIYSSLSDLDLGKQSGFERQNKRGKDHGHMMQPDNIKDGDCVCNNQLSLDTYMVLIIIVYGSEWTQ